MQEGPGRSIYQRALRRLASDNDCLIFGNDESAVEALVKELKRSSDISNQGKTVEEYIGEKIDHNKNGLFRMYQPHLMKRIIKAIPGMQRATEHKIPAATPLVLTKVKDGKARQEKWNYRSVIGMLNFLVNSTHPELVYSAVSWPHFPAPISRPP
eukprot:14658146-Ditylum_brightwellii.AAC.2